MNGPQALGITKNSALLEITLTVNDWCVECEISSKESFWGKSRNQRSRQIGGKVLIMRKLTARLLIMRKLTARLKTKS